MPKPADRGLHRGATMEALNRELRWLNAYSVLFSHLLARRLGINPTDLEAHDVLTLSGSISAGQLAALTGLTTGAVTTLIDRMEDAGLARREPDPADRRRVMVRALPPPADTWRLAIPEFEAMGQQMAELLGRYDDREQTLILDFLERARAVSAVRIAALGGGPVPSGPDGGSSEPR